MFAYVCQVKSCDWLGPLFHFFLLGSQTWYFMMTVDLLTALRNPFTDLQSNVKYYHVVVWGTNLLAIVIISSSNQFAYRPGLQVCASSSYTGTSYNFGQRCASAM